MRGELLYAVGMDQNFFTYVGTPLCRKLRPAEDDGCKCLRSTGDVAPAPACVIVEMSAGGVSAVPNCVPNSSTPWLRATARVGLLAIDGPGRIYSGSGRVETWKQFHGDVILRFFESDIYL